MEEWKAMADRGWGEELFYRPIRTEKGDIYIGFWDTDNNDNLFIKRKRSFEWTAWAEVILGRNCSFNVGLLTQVFNASQKIVAKYEKNKCSEMYCDLMSAPV